MLVQDGKLLVEKRRADKRLLPNIVSIPGGHNEAGESADEALVRELSEELNVAPLSYKFLCSLLHFSQEYRRLHYFAVEDWSGEIVMQEAADLFWIGVDQHDALDLEVDQIALKEFKRIYG